MLPGHILLRLPVKCNAMESCAPGLTSWNFVFSFLPLYKNFTLQFAAPFLPVCKPEAVGAGIALRAWMLIVINWEKNKNLIPACQSLYTFLT